MEMTLQTGWKGTTGMDGMAICPGAQDAKPGVMDEPEEFEGKAKRQTTKWVFPNIGVPQKRWFMENPIEMDDLGVPPFSETPK